MELGKYQLPGGKFSRIKYFRSLLHGKSVVFSTSIRTSEGNKKNPAEINIQLEKKTPTRSSQV